jgi:Holliday junction DNA helicase RuvB
LKEDTPTGSDFIDQALHTEQELEAALRPPSFDDFTGQRKTIERLQVMVGAAEK